jgi:L-seryl-tRNA(Ser) seleniumtransferase
MIPSENAMTQQQQQQLLRQLPAVDAMLQHEQVCGWLSRHPRGLVIDALRDAIQSLRRGILAGHISDSSAVSEQALLQQLKATLETRTQPHVRAAINATGIILHTALGRAVWPGGVVEQLGEELKGYVTLAIDRESGKRSERHERLEYILAEMTGAEASVVVNNNAAATLLVLAALAGGGECIVSRGQLIEIGGSFRLPDVMEISRASLHEVGTTNRTHLRDYAGAINDRTRAVLRVHPSNYRIMGFASQPELPELVKLAHEHGLPLIDDLGAGAIVSLGEFGLPHEPTIRESINAGADVVLVSGDKLIGAAQAGIIVGRKDCIQKIRKHPLYRAMRVDKSCLMVLERTLMLFRDLDKLKAEHPTYRMLATSKDDLHTRAEALAAAITAAAPHVDAEVVESVGYLGSGSLPMEELPGWAVRVEIEGIEAGELARRLRMDEACVFSRIENETVTLDTRTLSDADVPAVAQAVGRCAS